MYLGFTLNCSSSRLSHQHCPRTPPHPAWHEVINARVLIALSSVARLPILFLSSSSCRLDLCSLYLAQERDLCWVSLPWSLLCPLGHFFLRQALENRRKERTDSITQEKEVGLGCEGPAASLYRHLLATCLITWRSGHSSTSASGVD